MFVQFICVINTFAQKFDYQWLQGIYYTGGNNSNFILDFNNIPPLIKMSNSKFSPEYTSLSISDSSGLFNFYTNGCEIFGKESLLLDEGDSLLANNEHCNYFEGNGLDVNQGVFTITMSGNIFMLFSYQNTYHPVSNDCYVTQFVYHTVDMNANQGKGQVLEKNQVLKEGCFQIACANKHANGRDWWILLADNQQNYFYRWLLTPNGLEGPWTQEIYNPTIDGIYFCGWSEFSPDGYRYIINNCRKGVAVYDFDRCTGLLYGPSLLSRTVNNSNWWNYGAAYSPNGQYLYTVNNGSKELLQYDLSAPDIQASKKLIDEYDLFTDTTGRPTLFGFMQEGPDGKTYIWGGDTYYMHVIDFPNRSGIDCHVKKRAIQLPNSVFAANLYYPRYRLGPIDGSSCDTLGIDNLPQALFRYDLEDTLSPLQVTFTDLTSYAPTAWHWDFGDGTTSSETDPVHTYTAAGDYQVCLIASNANAADTFCRQVKVGVLGIEQLPVLPQLSVSPNPFGSVLRIDLPALISEKPHFVLYDLFGREVASAYLHDFQTELPLGRLPAGMYLWRAYLRGTAMQSGKVVRE